jgi:hypothetical protein
MLDEWTIHSQTLSLSTLTEGFSRSIEETGSVIGSKGTDHTAGSSQIESKTDRSPTVEQRLVSRPYSAFCLDRKDGMQADMSVEAVWACAAHVKRDPLIQSSEISKALEREIAPYAKFAWVISEKPFEAAGNLCYLLHVPGMNIRTV